MKKKKHDDSALSCSLIRRPIQRWGWLFLLAAPLLVKQARYVMREMDPVAMRPMLERTVKGAFLTNLL